MMRKNKYFLALSGLVIIFTFSCNNSHKTSRQILKRAGLLMYVLPDSALHLLEDSVRVDRLSRGDYATWCLFYTQARDMNYLPHTSDSLVRVAVDYYEKHKDPSRLMLAYYEMGRVQQEVGDARRAQASYQKALAVGKPSGDSALLARVYSNLGMLYLYQDAYSEALPYLKQAGSIFWQIKDTVNLSYSLREMARAYSMSGQFDSSIVYYNRDLLYAEPDEHPFILNELGSIYLEKGEIDSAHKYVREALEYDNEDEDFSPVYLALGEIYMKTTKPDSAKYYLYKVINSPESNLFSKAEAYYHLYHIAKENRQWEAYALYQEEYETLQDSVREKTYTETILKMESLYNYEKAENEANFYKLRHAESQEKILLLLLYGIILSAFCAALVVYYRIRKSKREKDLASFLRRLEQKKFRVSNEQVDENNKRIEEIDSLVSRQPAKKILLLEKRMLNSTNRWILNRIQEKNPNGNLLQEEAIYKKLHALSTLKITDNDYDSLYEAIAKLYPGFYAQLNNFGLSMENIQTASLIKARLSQAEIKRLFGNRRNTAHMRLDSLAQKLFKEESKADGWKENLFNYIINL